MAGLALNNSKPLTIQSQALLAGTCLISIESFDTSTVMIFPYITVRNLSIL